MAGPGGALVIVQLTVEAATGRRRLCATSEGAGSPEPGRVQVDGGTQTPLLLLQTCLAADSEKDPPSGRLKPGNGRLTVASGKDEFQA